MASIGEILRDVEVNLERTNVGTAQQQLGSLIDSLSKDDLTKWKPDLEQTIGKFFPKRRKVLQTTLTHALKRNGLVDAAQADPNGNHIKFDPLEFVESVRGELHDLSELHIFQWSTYYRDWIADLVERLIDVPSPQRGPVLAEVELSLAEHSREIFEKGFRFKVIEQGKAEIFAHGTALSGLQRFTELCVEYYAGGALKEKIHDRRTALRTCVSHVLAGILRGFSECNFASKSGAQLMASNRVRWFHYLAFVDASGISRLAETMGDGSVSTTLLNFFKPLACALDKTASMTASASPLPHISQYFHEQRKLEVVLRTVDSARISDQVEAFVLLDPEHPALATLKEAEARGISLVICSLKRDVAASTAAERMQKCVVDINEDGQSRAQFEARACDILSAALTRLAGRENEAFLEYNFARTFPLNNPFQSKYFHVVRRSVRNLIRELEGANGIRLWCSVRRSGKTTACNDLGGSLPSAEIVVQTCERTKSDDISGRIYGSILEHIEQSTPIPSNFLVNVIDEIRQSASATGKVVLVIDEYETLFGRLRGAARHDDDLKYSIVFPLLDQFVGFARENMVVLVGQQPNAHYIFMDQNKLSAYVTQDSFPLFHHIQGSTSSEFVDLITKVLTERFDFTGSFADALFKETCGHPFLTVNMLVSLVDWLISKRIKVSDVRFNESILSSFSNEELTQSRIAINTEYQFFIEAAADAMSENGMRSNPWLWSVYRAMRMFVETYGPHSACSMSEFSEIYTKAGLGGHGVSSAEILRTGDDANFFRVDSDSHVTLGIPLLARIAAAATPRTY